MKSRYREPIIKITNGVCKNLTDFLLYLFFLTGSSIGKRGSQGVYEAFSETDKILETVNYEAIKIALKSLMTKSSLHKDAKGVYSISQTIYDQIKKETELLQKRRIWNGKIYLILYDIPVLANNKRWIFRRFLNNIKAAKLQDSSYICFYNPKAQLREFIIQYRLPGTILVTQMSKDSSIGEKPLTELIRQVYKLNSLNKNYQEIWEALQNKKESKTRLYFKFISFQQVDPKLPYELLPRPWYGRVLENHFSQKLIQY